jgi:hypothetical protein
MRRQASSSRSLIHQDVRSRRSEGVQRRPTDARSTQFEIAETLDRSERFHDLVTEARATKVHANDGVVALAEFFGIDGNTVGRRPRLRPASA